MPVQTTLTAAPVAVQAQVQDVRPVLALGVSALNSGAIVFHRAVQKEGVVLLKGSWNRKAGSSRAPITPLYVSTSLKDVHDTAKWRILDLNESVSITQRANQLEFTYLNAQGQPRTETVPVVRHAGGKHYPMLVQDDAEAIYLFVGPNKAFHINPTNGVPAFQLLDNVRGLDHSGWTKLIDMSVTLNNSQD